MNKIEALCCSVCLLAGLRAPFFGISTTTDDSCDPKDLTDREKQIGQNYLQSKNRREISTGEQELSALQTSPTQETTNARTGEQEWPTSTASSHVTSLMPTAEQKVASLATVTTQTIASCQTSELELTAFPTTSPPTTAPFQNNEQEESALFQVKFPTPDGEQELSFPPATTLKAAPSSQAEEQELSTSQTPSSTTKLTRNSSVS